MTCDDYRLISDVSFAAAPGTLTAIIGPSGAGKSTLVRLLGGCLEPTAGTVMFDDQSVHSDYASLRSRIGVVPQDDVMHRQLSVQRALSYAAELRLRDADQRAPAVSRVLDELDLTDQRGIRVDKLSGGQRKRASVAMELLTGPSLLILDEPTSGLDPALDRQVMTVMRRLADDADRVVVVVTHSLNYLHLCDQVLLLAPGGRVAYCGPPQDIKTTMGSADWADIFTALGLTPRADAPHIPVDLGPCVRRPAAASSDQSWPAALHHIGSLASTVARRQLRLTMADRSYFTFLAILPFILGLLALSVPGDTGLGPADPQASNPNEAAQVLILLNVSAVFMGIALTIRDLVGERSIFTRERAVGLSPTAYLGAKLGVHSALGILQSAILTTIILLGKGGPTYGAVALHNSTFELFTAVALTTVVSCCLGLWLSSLARTTEQVLPLLVTAIMTSIVFCSGLIPMAGRAGLEQLSWLFPARFGFAATAVTVNLPAVSPFIRADDPLWTHSLQWWLFSMAALAFFGAVLAIATRWRLRLCPRKPRLRHRTPRLAVATGHQDRFGYRPSLTSASESSAEQIIRSRQISASRPSRRGPDFRSHRESPSEKE